MSTDAWNLPDVRPGLAPDASLAARREQLRALDDTQIVDPAAVLSERSIAGVPCLVVGAPTARSTLLYVHGGGFRMGEPRTWAGFASRLAAAAGIRIVVPDYRLAPENPFPAALHDLVAVYRALLADRAEPVLLGGDSAGGGLAVSLTSLAQGAGAKPAGVLLLSPWLDLAADAASYADCAASDLAFSQAAAREAAAQYLAEAEASELASPLGRGSFADFPPLWISASASEVLRDDSLEIARRVAAAGGVVEMSVYPGLPHVWPLLMPAAPETRRTIDSMARFIVDREPLPTLP